MNDDPERMWYILSTSEYDKMINERFADFDITTIISMLDKNLITKEIAQIVLLGRKHVKEN